MFTMYLLGFFVILNVLVAFIQKDKTDRWGHVISAHLLVIVMYLMTIGQKL